MKLLYRLAEWHALAKLRMHTESTLALLDGDLTTELGALFRQFCKFTASSFSIRELPREAAARQRRQSSSGQQRLRALNISTVKFHFLGDYGAHIRRFGTTDSYSTQLVFTTLHLLGLTNWFWY